MIIGNGFSFLLNSALCLLPFIGVIESITECLAPYTIISGCTYQCKNPEYAFICEDDGVHAYKCNSTCPGGRCVQSLCKKMGCENKPDQYEQTYEKLCQGRNMQMGQGESTRGLKFRQSSREESTGYSIYLNTLVPILAGGLVMGILLLLVRFCGRRGQVRMVESPPPESPKVIAQPQIRYPCQLLPTMSFSSLPNPLYPINPQYLGQGGQFPNVQLAQVAGMSPNHQSKSPVSTRSNQPLLGNEVRPGSSTPNPKGDLNKKGNQQPLYASFHVESDFDLPPAYDDVVYSTRISEDDKNNPNPKKGGN